MKLYITYSKVNPFFFRGNFILAPYKLLLLIIILVSSNSRKILLVNSLFTTIYLGRDPITSLVLDTKLIKYLIKFIT